MFYFNTQKSIREVYEQPVRKLGVELIDYSTRIDFKIGELDIKNTGSYFLKENIHDFILLNTNASDLMPERRWPNEYWRTLIHYLLEQTNFVILLSGSKDECRKMEKEFGTLIKENKQRLYNVAGTFTLAEFICCIRRATMIITNDSGPLHLAFSQQKPVISLWGPTSPSHLSLKSHFNKELYKEVYCSPCLHHTDRPPCKGDNFCMKGILPYDVINSFLNLCEETGIQQNLFRKYS